MWADVNLYRYVGNNPLTWIDPFGLWISDWWDWHTAGSEAFNLGIGAGAGLALGVGLGFSVTVGLLPAAVAGGLAYGLGVMAAAGIGLATGRAITGHSLTGKYLSSAQRTRATMDALVGWLGIWGYAKGSEIEIGDDFRMAPFGNRTGNRFGEWPHYHRTIEGPNGKTISGGSPKWHRPYQKGF